MTKKKENCSRQQENQADIKRKYDWEKLKS